MEDQVTLNTTLSAQDQARNSMMVDSFNKANTVNGRAVTQELGKDSFLTLLVTQLSNQNPLDPMDNTEFIAQMAQFSSLEQMTNMNTNFENLNNMLLSSQAASTIGMNVDINTGDGVTTGLVESVTYGQNPQVKVGNMYYDLKQISAVYGY